MTRLAEEASVALKEEGPAQRLHPNYALDPGVVGVILREESTGRISVVAGPASLDSRLSDGFWGHDLVALMQRHEAWLSTDPGKACESFAATSKSLLRYLTTWLCLAGGRNSGAGLICPESRPYFLLSPLTGERRAFFAIGESAGRNRGHYRVSCE